MTLRPSKINTLPLERLKKRSFYPKVRISDIFSQRSDWPRSRHSNSDQFVPRGFELRTITTTLQRGLTVLPTRADERSDKEIKCDENVREIKKGPGFQPKKNYHLFGWSQRSVVSRGHPQRQNKRSQLTDYRAIEKGVEKTRAHYKRSSIDSLIKHKWSFTF